VTGKCLGYEGSLPIPRRRILTPINNTKYR
jgi:hypothetical protein